MSNKHTDCRCANKTICVHKVKAHRVKADTAVIKDAHLNNLNVDCLMINQACGISADTSISGSLVIGTPRDLQLGSRVATAAAITVNGNSSLNGPVAIASSLRVDTDHDVGGNSNTSGSHNVGADCNVTGNSRVYGNCQTDGDHTVNGCSKPNCLVV